MNNLRLNIEFGENTAILETIFKNNFWSRLFDHPPKFKQTNVCSEKQFLKINYKNEFKELMAFGPQVSPTPPQMENQTISLSN